MKTITSILAAVAVTALTSGTAIAKCHETTGSVTQQGISKDGTHVPLENGANSKTQTGAASTGTTTSSTTDTAQKDGKTTPLAEQGGGVDKNLATSGQDVMAQQKGEKTAAAKGADATDCIE
ncbi:hypothetical protein [Phyllobacterium zundukense]|uniref:Exopolysaccharide production protein YjbE n=1 Tax=Phyllobacterium zundukense TaxID=1867719 RepID=A0A2N9VYA5_9HYPH|nr:hypothetical protein [Phyllobacterium zundukense]ATU94987.1 hypothetical protein BLM14_24990 [Phyllobacterium zundukense]PIO44473.1 hypothetical protein B5P45_12730 [Phyllobacterium zundukense]